MQGTPHPSADAVVVTEMNVQLLLCAVELRIHNVHAFSNRAPAVGDIKQVVERGCVPVVDFFRACTWSTWGNHVTHHAIFPVPACRKQEAISCRWPRGAIARVCELLQDPRYDLCILCFPLQSCCFLLSVDLPQRQLVLLDPPIWGVKEMAAVEFGIVLHIRLHTRLEGGVLVHVRTHGAAHLQQVPCAKPRVRTLVSGVEELHIRSRGQREVKQQTSEKRQPNHRQPTQSPQAPCAASLTSRQS
mmetsp:Transcript_121419/g.350566  ORF Transcript_121419/g.350566 Transcript_121419/m.350566 type:complete len:245 (+) Transcript_121419:441-1175(+)